MITPKELTHPAVRAFVTALVEQNADAFHETVAKGFTFSSEEETDGADVFLSTRSTVLLHDQSADGLTLTGLAVRRDEGVPVRWVFTPVGGKVGVLDVDSNVTLPNSFWGEALPLLEKALRQAEEPDAEEFDTPEGPSGEKHPRGTLRRREMWSTQYVHEWTAGALGGIDWINTGRKAGDAVHASFRSPASGRHDDRGHTGGVSSVSSDLTVELRWDGDGYQKAAVSFAAKPYMWESVCWLGENVDLVDKYIPVIRGTLTLTGPDGTVIATEALTAKGVKPPYELSFTREFALKDRPVGTYTLAFTDAVKTGGRRTTDGANHTGKDEVRLRAHVLTFTVGG
ncbi:hypothetical protein ACN20G_27595 (plasmid) [Streptomyces sp. BI20]|uniref:hypothetical protein n=1 Tax=Streptomyces sp. BI20 TaxID=3403460 RepID=UPI003C71ADB3